jgi:hypothetical protein
MKLVLLLVGLCLVPHTFGKPPLHESSVRSVSKPAVRRHVIPNGTSAGRSLPVVEKLEFITQLPKELPQRVADLDFYGEKLWAVIYLGQGRYATFDPVTYGWTVSYSNQHHQAIKEVAGIFESPGGFCFANGKLWIAGSYGETFGSIDFGSAQVEQIFKVRQQSDRSASQVYTGLTFDGSHLWMAWHWFKYRLPTSQTQLLLKIDPQTGKVIQQFSLPPGKASDGIHGLTWDGKQLWHVKDHLLAAIDPATGQVTARYTLKSLKRPGALSWDGSALWIAEFEGRIFRLPFEEERLATRIPTW